MIRKMPEGRPLCWATDRKKIFASCSKLWPGFMTRPGHTMVAVVSDELAVCWAEFRITARDPEQFPPRDKLTWDACFDTGAGQRTVWSFDNLEAAIHHWLTYHDDLPTCVKDPWEVYCNRRSAVMRLLGVGEPEGDDVA